MIVTYKSYDPNFKVVPDRNLTHVQCSCVLIVLRFNFVEILVEEESGVCLWWCYIIEWCKMHLGLETLLLSKSYTQVSLFNASLSCVCVTHTVHDFVNFIITSKLPLS